MIIYVGSVGNNKGFISGNGEGIYTLKLEDEKLKLTGTQESVNPSILCFNHDKTVLYCVNETNRFAGCNGSGGGISAFLVKENGKFMKRNDSISYGSKPSYITVSQDQKYLFVTNHGSHSTVTCHYIPDEEGRFVLQRGFDDASLAVFRINEDGSIGSLLDLKVFENHGYWCHGGGQSTSHLHCVKERNGLIFCANRGADEIEVLTMHEDHLKVLNIFQTRPAFAPRHIDLHPDKNLIYVANENYPCMNVYSYDPDGTIRELQMLETMPSSYYEKHPLPAFEKREADENEVNNCGMSDLTLAMPSDIHITKDGRFVYISNRRFKGIGSIATFRTQEDGTLEYVQTTELDCGDPRGFQIIDDQYLIIAECDQNTVSLYALDTDTGIPDQLLSKVHVNSPCSLLIKSY